MGGKRTDLYDFARSFAQLRHLIHFPRSPAPDWEAEWKALRKALWIVNSIA